MNCIGKLDAKLMRFYFTVLIFKCQYKIIVIGRNMILYLILLFSICDENIIANEIFEVHYFSLFEISFKNLIERYDINQKTQFKN